MAIKENADSNKVPSPDGVTTERGEFKKRRRIKARKPSRR